MKETLVEAIVNMEEENALKIAKELLDGGEAPLNILEECRKAMTIIGDGFEKHEYYLPELLMAGEILQGIADFVKPRIQGKTEQAKTVGKVVLGTVEGDIHDVGKDIVGFMLDISNFEVHDLGVDVSTQTFVEKIEEVQPQIVAMSGFLTLAFDAMKATVEAISKAGCRDRVKIMIGGAPMDQAVVSYVGADAYRPDAAAAVKLAQEWIGGM